jgi:hypothetical protein
VFRSSCRTQPERDRDDLPRSRLFVLCVCMGRQTRLGNISTTAPKFAPQRDQASSMNHASALPSRADGLPSRCSARHGREAAPSCPSLSAKYPARLPIEHGPPPNQKVMQGRTPPLPNLLQKGRQAQATPRIPTLTLFLLHAALPHRNRSRAQQAAP